MSRVGYKGTAPAQVFLSFNYEALLDTGGGLSNYDDPLNLKDTMLSFEYTPADTPNAQGSHVKIVLINPDTNVENLLFSKYAAFTPRAWKSQDEVFEELRKNSQNLDRAFLRWGYISNDLEDSSKEQTALSHIHRVHLIEIDYDINSNQDRLVTLRFSDSFDTFIRSYLASEVSLPAFSVDLTDGENKLRKISDVIGERLLSVLGMTDGYEFVNNMSSAHRQSLDEALRGALATVTNKDIEEVPSLEGKQMPAVIDMPTILAPQENVTDDDVKNTLSAYHKFIQFLGGALRVPTEDGDAITTIDGESVVLSKIPEPQPSLNSEGVENVGTLDNPNPKAASQAKVAATADPNERVRVFFESIPFSQKDVNPLSKRPGGNPDEPLYTFRYIYFFCTYDADEGLKTMFTLDELRQMYGDMIPPYGPGSNEQNDKFKYMFITQPALNASLKETGGWWPWTDSRAEKQEKYIAYDDEGNRLFSYRAAREELWNMILFLEKKYGSASESVDDTAHAAAVSDVSEAGEEAGLEASTGAAEEAAAAAAIEKKKYTAIFENQGHPIILLSQLIDALNQAVIRFGSSKLLSYARFEYANIPPERRTDFVQAIGHDLDFDSYDGVFVLADSDEIERLTLSYSEPIKSFAIQVAQDEKRLSLASGFSKRKDNIITGISFRQDNAKMYTALRMAPAFKQKLYVVGKRFENPEYRDAIAQAVYFEWNKIDGPDNSPNDSSKSDVDVRSVPADNFSDDVVNYNLKAALRYSDTSNGDSINPDIPKLTEEMKEDLKFILNNNFMDIFFPVSDGSQSRVSIKSNTGEDELVSTKKIPFYRSMSASPLAALTSKTKSENEEKALLYAAKMETLSQLQNTISDVEITTLGIPELDMLPQEQAVRKVALWVAEPRSPGEYNWITGTYMIVNLSHRIDESGYTSNFTLQPWRPQISEELVKHQTAFLSDD